MAIMTKTTAYDVRLRGPSGAIVQYIVRARDGNQANALALERAAILTEARGNEYRVARVDPA